jgi:RTX calcium-binding nonapeptide repeat (4 copies)
VRTVFRLALPTLLALGLAVAALPASANHNADLHSSNVQLLDTEPPPTTATNSDLAFWGNRLYAGNYNGFRIFDISNGANPTLVTNAVCTSTPSGQHDISVWNTDADAQADLLFLSVDGPRIPVAPNTDPTACATGSTAGTTATSTTADHQVAWEGVRIFDIGMSGGTGTEAAPVQIAAVPTDCGSHTHTLVPTEDGVGAPAANASLYLYISSYPTSNQTNDTDFGNFEGTNPDGSSFPLADRVAGQRSNGTDCLEPEPRPDSATADWTANQGHNKISIIEVNLSDPAAADDAVLETDGAAGFSAASCPGAADNCVVYPQVIEVAMPTGTRTTHLAGITRTTEFTACHDISVFMELNLAAGSCWDEGILWDISNPEVPDFLRRIRLDEVDLLFHSVTFSWDGKVLAFEDEAGGGTDDRCRSSGDQQGRMWFTDPDLNVLGSFKIPRPQPKGENCTAHLYNFIPQDDDRDILVSAWYKGATSVADATQPAQTKEIGFYDVQAGAGLTDDSDVWASYWYNGFIYVNDIQRGLDTLAFNDARAENAMTLPFFNPQTQMDLIAQTPPKCGNRDAGVFGTSERDVLATDDLPDVIQALGGNDIVSSEGGNDRDCGGSGNDRLKGQGNSDRLFGEQGRDRLNGGLGNDRLVGGPGRDVCVGGPGKDRARQCEREIGIEA